MVKRIAEKVLDAVLIVVAFEIANHAYCMVEARLRK